MYKDIANFLKESPEWVKSWLNIPVKAKYIQNPLMIPEIMANVLNYLPLGQHRGICQLWDKEIDHAHEAREKTLKQFVLFDFKYFYEKNSAWKDQVDLKLNRRQTELTDNYWEIAGNQDIAVNNYLEVYDENNNYATFLGDIADKLTDQRRDAFRELVKVEKCLIDYGFASIMTSYYRYHLAIFENGGFASLDDEADYANLYNVNPLDYWDDEDPDEYDEDSDV